MKKKLIIISMTCALALGMLGGCAPSAADGDKETNKATNTEQTAPASSDKTTKVKEVVAEECISCHSLEEVAVGSADYVAESGEVANPHRTIDEDASNPHEATGNEHAIDCGKCHTAHESDTPSADDVSLPENVNYCYTKCHHQRTFEDCSNCHNDR